MEIIYIKKRITQNMSYPYIVYFFSFFLTKNRAHREPVTTAVAILPLHDRRIEAEEIGARLTRSVERTTPTVTVAAHIIHASIVSVTSSRKL